MLYSTIERLSLLSLIFKGGWVMIPLFLLSIVALYAIIERAIALHRTLRAPKHWIEKVNTKLIAGDLPSVHMLCDKKSYAIARIIQAGLEKYKQPHQAFQKTVENAAQQEVYQLEKNIALLGTIASAAPMLGFLGTVLGMIQAFMAMAQQTQQISPKLLSGGIYEAMITTAAGLIIGIVAHISYNYFIIRIQNATRHIEQGTNQFIELVENYAPSR